MKTIIHVSQILRWGWLWKRQEGTITSRYEKISMQTGRESLSKEEGDEWNEGAITLPLTRSLHIHFIYAYRIVRNSFWRSFIASSFAFTSLNVFSFVCSRSAILALEASTSFSNLSISLTKAKDTHTCDPNRLGSFPILSEIVVGDYNIARIRSIFRSSHLGLNQLKLTISCICFFQNHIFLLHLPNLLFKSLSTT